MPKLTDAVLLTNKDLTTLCLMFVQFSSDSNIRNAIGRADIHDSLVREFIRIEDMLKTLFRNLGTEEELKALYDDYCKVIEDETQQTSS